VRKTIIKLNDAGDGWPEKWLHDLRAEFKVHVDQDLLNSLELS